MHPPASLALEHKPREVQGFAAFCTQGARAGVNGFLSRLPCCGRPCEPDSGARSRPGGRQAGSELDEQRALGPRAGRVAETRAPGSGAGDKG